jgi:CRP-like cAMP-binding protein
MYVTFPTEYSDCKVIPKVSAQTPAAGTTRVRAGSHLYFEGDEVEWLYQVRSGVLRLTRLLEDGRRQVIAFAFPGDVVGFPCEGLHHADCDVLIDACLQPYRRSLLEDGRGAPEIHTFLLQATLSEIGAMQDHFLMLGRKSAVEKVSSFLGVLAQRIGTDIAGCPQFDLPMRRADIADFLGLTTETVCRTLTLLRGAGVIGIENVHTVTIKRPHSLLELSQNDCG